MLGMSILVYSKGILSNDILLPTSGIFPKDTLDLSD